MLDFEFWILNFFDIGGVPHALGSVTAIFNGVPSCYLPDRRFRRYAASPPSIHLVALTGSKIRRTCERTRAKFHKLPLGGEIA